MRQLEEKDLRPAGPGVWRVRRFLRYDKASGKAVKPSATFYARTAREALPQAQEWWERQLQAAGLGTGTKLGPMLLNRVATLEALGELEPATARAYESKVRNYIGPALGRMDAADVRPSDVNDLYVHLLESGSADGEGLSAATVRVVHAILKGSYRAWVAAGVVDRSPVESATPPPRVNPATRALDAPELDALGAELAGRMGEAGTSRTQIRERTYAMAAYLALHTGMREGEVCAVRRRDASLAPPSILVCGKVTEALGAPMRSPRPKGSSSRKVSVEEGVCRAIEEHCAWQGRFLPKAMLARGRELPLCCNRDGGWLRPSALSRWFTSLCRGIGIREATFHTLRHTHATVLIAQGVDVKTVSERLGHARTSTTTDIYAHALPGRDAAAAEAFGRAMERGSRTWL